jgi:hypothetical protein
MQGINSLGQFQIRHDEISVRALPSCNVEIAASCLNKQPRIPGATFQEVRPAKKNHNWCRNVIVIEPKQGPISGDATHSPPSCGGVRYGPRTQFFAFSKKFHAVSQERLGLNAAATELLGRAQPLLNLEI